MRLLTEYTIDCSTHAGRQPTPAIFLSRSNKWASDRPFAHLDGILQRPNAIDQMVVAKIENKVNGTPVGLPNRVDIWPFGLLEDASHRTILINMQVGDSPVTTYQCLDLR
jgi:hypothetical protein